MKKFFSKEVIIGISVIVSLVMLFAGIEFLKGINVFKSSNTYIAKYTNVTGLAVSAPVTVTDFRLVWSDPSITTIPSRVWLSLN